MVRAGYCLSSPAPLMAISTPTFKKDVLSVEGVFLADALTHSLCVGPLVLLTESTLSNALIEETGYYDNKQKINDNYYLYWKVMGGSTPEIEIAMKVRTTSWVGLGWRPNGG